MTPEQLQIYTQRQRILNAMLAALELDHSRATRQRTHEFCFGMTDLSPRSNSPEFSWDGIESLPVDTATNIEETADNGYFDPNNVPGRSYGTDNDVEMQVETNEDAEDNELESGESEERESTEARFRRYVTSEMCEVSDPEEWMEIHHHSDISSETLNFDKEEVDEDVDMENSDEREPQPEREPSEPRDG